MDNTEIEKSKVMIIRQEIDYVPHAVSIRTVIRKPTGDVRLVSLDAGEELHGRTSAFDTFIQVIDGVGELIINDEIAILHEGEAIVIPAHSRNFIKAKAQLKIISTVIKSGYEDFIG